MRNKKRKKKGKENWHLQRPSSIQAGTWLKIIGRLFQIFQTKYFRYRFHHSFLDFLNFLSKRRNRLVEARKTARETERKRKRERELSSRVRQQREINNPSFLMPRYRASSRLYNAAGAPYVRWYRRISYGLAASKVSASKYKLPR